MSEIFFAISMIACTVLFAVGALLSMQLSFLQIRRPLFCLGTVLGEVQRKNRDGVSPFSAFATAIGSTVGVGNIAGVGIAIAMGGAGAIFWMWVCAFFGMATKYAEIVLSVHFRKSTGVGVYGGPMYYIEYAFGKKWVASVFAFCGLCACFGIGNMAQSGAIAATTAQTVPGSEAITGLLLCIATYAVIMGGIKRISTLAQTIVPLMAALYILAAIFILFRNADEIPSAFSDILNGAFNLTAGGGGVAGYGIARAVRYGIARGVFSNEAGLGSAPVAHAASAAKHPVEQGFFGIFEVFISTFVLCTLTALVILTSGIQVTQQNCAAITALAFSATLGSGGVAFLSVAIILFAFTSIIGWAYYGEQFLRYLAGGERLLRAYRFVFVFAVFIGAVSSPGIVFELSDILNALMALPNLAALAVLCKKVKQLTAEYFDGKH